MTKKGPRPSAERRSYWQTAIELQRESGLSVRKFCASEGLAESAFYYWRRELASPKQRALSEQGKPAAPKFMPVEIHTASSLLVIELPSGTKLNIGEDCPMELLQNTLELLRC